MNKNTMHQNRLATILKDIATSIPLLIILLGMINCSKGKEELFVGKWSNINCSSDNYDCSIKIVKENSACYFIDSRGRFPCYFDNKTLKIDLGGYQIIAFIDNRNSLLNVIELGSTKKYRKYQPRAAVKIDDTQNAMKQIWKCVKKHKAETGKWPANISELKGLSIDSEVSKNWDFEIAILAPKKGDAAPHIRILATSTSLMAGGEGKIILYEPEIDDWKGFGINYN
jgi:hypothetical protein